MRKVSGALLLALGVGHAIVGVLGGIGYIDGVLGGGFFKADEPGFPPLPDFWFISSGFFLILLAQLSVWVDRRFGYPLPAFVGWELLAFFIVGAVLMPVAPFWFAILIALYLIVTSRRTVGPPVNLT